MGVLVERREVYYHQQVHEAYIFTAVLTIRLRLQLRQFSACRLCAEPADNDVTIATVSTVSSERFNVKIENRVMITDFFES